MERCSLLQIAYIVAAQFQDHVDVCIILEESFKLYHVRVLQCPMNLNLCL
jgi:hypothetical protein